MCLALALAGLGAPARSSAQAGAAPPAPPTPRAISPIDLTGYWVSVVTEDWHFRMVTPPKGDYGGIPLNPAGHKVADTWDPDKDIAAGNQCKSYGAVGLTRVPSRLHIYWEDDNTLRMDTDAGTQTRRFHLVSDTPPEAMLLQLPKKMVPGLQGYSVAQWEGLTPTGPRAVSVSVPDNQKEGYLGVLTTGLLPGYIRKNGVPYSANALLEEYFDTFTEPNGDKWLVITAVLTDPTYLTIPFITSTHFKAQPDAKGWNPTPCEAK